MEGYSAPIYKWWLLLDFWLNNGFSPQEASVANDTISKEACRVLVLRCRSTSQLTCLVSFHRVSSVIYSYTVVQSYKLYIYTIICSYKLHPYIHTFIQPYIHALIFSHIHTHHIHNINSYMVASVTQSLVCSYPLSSVLTHHCVKW